MVSVIIPARNEVYLKKTIEDLLKKAKEEVEIIAILDGYWPNLDEFVTDPRVTYIHFTTPRGMRGAINSGVRASKGEFLMKVDAHCIFGEGYDKILKADCGDKTISVPRRYALNVETWDIEKRSDDKYPIDFMVLNETLQGIPTKQRLENGTADLMTSQGSCWFMKRETFDWLELLDEETYGTFWQEFQEIGLKCWLSGGRVIVNTKTWYGHFHKTEGRGYTLPKDEQEKTRAVVSKWREKKMFHKQIHDLQWLFDKFKK